MATDPASERPAPTTEWDGPRLPEGVDWIAGVVVALAGMALALAGAAVQFVVDLPEFSAALADGARDTTVLGQEEVVEVALTAGTWTGWGLLLTGGTLVIVAVGYVVHRRRVRSGRTDEPTGDFLANAVVGAVTSVVLSFVPFSPVTGGAVAGYFECRESERVVGVGALSGLLAVSPLLAVVAFVVGGLAVGLFDVGAGGLATVVVIVACFSLLVLATVCAGLGAVGGYAGGWLAER